MRQLPHVSAVAVTGGHPDVRTFLVAIAVIAICALLVALAVTLPGRSPDGVVLGAGTTIVTMIASARPGLAAPLYGLVAILAALRAYAWSRATSPGSPSWGFIRLGGFWLAIPAAAFATISARTAPDLAYAVETLAVFALIMTAGRRRGRDLSVGYAAGLLLALSVLVAAAYARWVHAPVLLAYPADLTGLLALVCAGRIGLDRSFARWQRLAAFGIGAVTLVAAASPVAFIAAAAGGLAYLISRLRTTALPEAIRGRSVAGLRAGVPLIAISALWLVSVASIPARTPPKRAGAASLGRPEAVHPVSLAAFEHTGVIGKIFGFAAPGPLGALSRAGLLGLIALAVGAALVTWHVTGPGLPVWLPVVGLAGLVGVLGGGVATAGPSPAWIMAFAAELWVFCHGLRPDRDVTQPPELIDDDM